MPCFYCAFEPQRTATDRNGPQRRSSTPFIDQLLFCFFVLSIWSLSKWDHSCSAPASVRSSSSQQHVVRWRFGVSGGLEPRDAAAIVLGAGLYSQAIHHRAQNAAQQSRTCAAQSHSRRDSTRHMTFTSSRPHSRYVNLCYSSSTVYVWLCDDATVSSWRIRLWPSFPFASTDASGCRRQSLYSKYQRNNMRCEGERGGSSGSGRLQSQYSTRRVAALEQSWNAARRSTTF